MSPRSPVAQTIETHHLHWDDIQIKITHATNWLDSRIDHLEITSILPERCALPIPETGYRSHYVGDGVIRVAGGAVPFVRTWLEAESGSRVWQEIRARSAQLRLF